MGQTYELTWELDEQGDMKFTGVKTPSVLEGSAKVQQDLRILFETQLGENIFNTNFGFDMVSVVANRSFDAGLIEQKVRDALLQYRFLENINSIDVGEPNENRVSTVAISITTSFEDVVQFILEVS